MAIPSKGRLVEPTLDFLRAVGIRLQAVDERALVVPTSWQDLNIVRMRPEDIPSIVESGSAALGITGLDYVVESGASVDVLERLGYGKGRIMVAVPASSGIRSIEDIRDDARVATKYVNITRRFFEEVGRRVRILRISGSAEVMPMLGVADAIVDVVSTGTTLRIHGLRPVGTIMESECVMIAPREPDGDSRYFIEKTRLLVRSTLQSSNRKLVLMNVPLENLGNVLKVVPAMEGPTIADVASGRPIKEVISVVPEEELPDLLVKLKGAGARDILILSIEKVIP
jgi:ATP phosphoribosyltransferase